MKSSCLTAPTIQPLLNILLHRKREDVSLTPDFHHASNLVLYVRWRALVGGLRRFG
jgi:hypothetical protein